MFETITERNIGKPVAIILDGYTISAPNVNEKIPQERQLSLVNLHNFRS